MLDMQCVPQSLYQLNYTTTAVFILFSYERQYSRREAAVICNFVENFSFLLLNKRQSKHKQLHTHLLYTISIEMDFGTEVLYLILSDLDLTVLLYIYFKQSYFIPDFEDKSKVTKKVVLFRCTCCPIQAAGNTSAVLTTTNRALNYKLKYNNFLQPWGNRHLCQNF